MKKVGLLTATIVVAVFFFLLATLPPLPARLNVGIDPDLMRRTARGAYHIHSSRSDGAADKDAIAAAASRAGLAFIILTDHGDGTRVPDAPEYLHGVLCVDAVEISTNGGHYVALDMRPSPYPLGGEPEAVVEDVRRLGGFGIAAHPDSPRPQLAWSDRQAPIDGLEWLNADSEWRDESRLRLARLLFDYMWRPGPALASALDRPVTTLKRWDDLLQRRRVVALAGVDAHGGIGRGMEEGGKRRPALGTIPSYEASFRSFSTRAALDQPFTGQASADAASLISAIRNGHVFTAIDAIAGPAYIGIASDPSGRPYVNYVVGDGGELIMVRDGHDSLPLQEGRAGQYRFKDADMTGVVRFEVRVPHAPGTPPVPWIVSNPLYFSQPPARSPSPVSETVVPLASGASWHVEKDPDTEARTTASGEDVRFDHRLASGSRRSQFAAAVIDLQGAPADSTAIVFSIAAEHPARVSVQLRYPDRGGARWAKSVYAEPDPRQARVPFERMAPADFQSGQAPNPSAARSLLFVVDLTNARPGDSNAIRIHGVGFTVPAATSKSPAR
jgi:hypothetical protein